jgi:hypothetical protein
MTPEALILPASTGGVSLKPGSGEDLGGGAR